MNLDRIITDTQIMNGQPILKDRNMSYRKALAIISTYKDQDEMKSHYPELDEEDIRQVLAFSAANSVEI